MKKVVVALLTFLVLLGALEVAARQALPEPVAYADKLYHPSRGFRAVPGVERTFHDELGGFTFSLNSDGFRGREVPAEPPADDGVMRVAVVGDSFVQAGGVRDEDIFSATIERELAERGIEAQAWALGCGGYGTAQELLLLREFGARIRPDAVVLFVYLANDLINNGYALAGRTSMSNGDFFRPYLAPTGHEEWDWTFAMPARAMLRRTKLFQLFESRQLHEMSGEDRRRMLHGFDPRASGVRVAEGGLIAEHYEVFRVPPPDSPWHETRRATEELVERTRREAEELGARFLVVLIPNRMQVIRDATFRERQFFFEKLHGQPIEAVLDFEQPEGWIVPWLAERGIEAVPLLHAFRADYAASGESGYLMDGHLLGEWTRLAGRVAAARLLDEDPLPPEGERRRGPIDVPASVYPESGMLDLRERVLRELASPGWRLRISPGDGRHTWDLESRGVLLVPNRDGELVLHGLVRPNATLPLRLELLWNGEPLEDEVLEAKGRFVVRRRVARSGDDALATAWLKCDVPGEPTVSLGRWGVRAD